MKTPKRTRAGRASARMARGLILAAAASMTGALVPDVTEARGRRVVVVKPIQRPAKRVVINRPIAPRRVIVKSRVACRPWYASARVVTGPLGTYYYHATLGVYFGGDALRVYLSDAAPEGRVFLDPYTGRRFRTVAGYLRFAARHPGRLRLLTVVSY